MEIDYFTEIREGNVIDSVSGVPDLSGVPNVGANFLIFIDEFFPIGRDKEQVLRAIAERVSDNMQANDRIAIVAWNGDGIETISSWTSSVDEAFVANTDNWPTKPVEFEGTVYPNYSLCVDISTRGAQREMIFPSVMAIVTPVLVGLVFDVGGVMGMTSSPMNRAPLSISEL